MFIDELTTDNIYGATILHTRAKTRGDPSNGDNNHPHFGEKYCLVHNGVVHTMADLPDYTYKAECDSERLLSYIERYGVREAIPMIDGSAAFAVISPEDKKFYLYKHTSPLALAYYPGKAFVFSSLEFSLKKVGAMIGTDKLWGLFPTHSVIDFDEGLLVTIDMETGGISQEIIEVPTKVWNANKPVSLVTTGK